MINSYELARIITQETATHFGVSETAIRARRRVKTLVRARFMAMWLIRQMTPLSLSEIGKVFQRDHSTVCTACAKVDKEVRNCIAEDWALVASVQIRRAVDEAVRRRSDDG